MDVTSSNFKQNLPEILQAIDSCNFIAIDGEFTGLRRVRDMTMYDTPASRFAKLRDGSLEYLLLQMGLCTFKLDRSKNKYVYEAFNFYLFPRTFERPSHDVSFSCQASSITFLCETGFDFNKSFKEGIPYLNATDEKILLEIVDTEYECLKEKEVESAPKIRIPLDLVPTIEDACARIEKFLSPECREKEIVLDKCNPFARKLILQTAYERFSTHNFSLTTRIVGNSPVLVAQKGISRAEQNRENHAKSRKEIIEAVGFSKIIRHVSESKKLIVGHNMLLDICHVVNRFCVHLPTDYAAFRSTVHQLFPRIIDTKYICNAYPFKGLISSNVLNDLVIRMRESPFELLGADPRNPLYSYSVDECEAHKAGYDAYITGMVFISLMTYLSGTSDQESLLEKAKPFENKLALVQIVDYSCMNLAEDEPEPARDHVFHVTFPKDWKTNDIARLFRPYGDVRVKYCNQTSAFIILNKRENAREVVSDLIESRRRSDVSRPYVVTTCREFCNGSFTANSSRNMPSMEFPVPPPQRVRNNCTTL